MVNVILYLYNIYTINYSEFTNDDIYYFTFFENQTSSHIKIQTNFIKTLYYFCVNYEFVYKDLFIEIENSLYSSFNKNSHSLKSYVFKFLQASLIAIISA